MCKNPFAGFNATTTEITALLTSQFTVPSQTATMASIQYVVAASLQSTVTGNNCGVAFPVDAGYEIDASTGLLSSSTSIQAVYAFAGAYQCLNA